METGGCKTGGKYEIQLCLTCELPDCKPTSNQCPIRQIEDDARRDVLSLIKHSPQTKREIEEKMGLDKTGTDRVLRRLRRAKLIKNENGIWRAVK